MRCKILAMTVLLLFAASPSWAAEDVTGKYILDSFALVGDDNTIPPMDGKTAGLKTERAGKNLAGKKAGEEVFISVYYPQGTGNADVDKAIKAYADKAVETFNKDAAESLKGGFERPQTMAKTFTAVKPSDNYVSVVYYEFIDTGGAHPAWGYEAHTFNLNSGKEVAVENVFPNQDNIGFMANYVSAALDKKCLESAPDNRVCGPATVDVEAVKNGMSKMIFTPGGAVILFSPYDQGAYVEGAKYVEIPKDMLINWGVSDEFWK
ncbi:hypothetical protein C4J81_03865 [Deltaproteobacteria bacterium Smac51]|nr:hypothetical protein C4J81_03865 [Deltaproteobacteria bacterium Smac51]